MTRAAAFFVAAMTIIAEAGAQDSAPATRSDPADKLLAEIDSRIYSAEREGLKGVEFSYLPVASGPLEMTSFRVRVRWEKGKKESIEFVKPDGSPFAELPEILRQPPPREGVPSVKEQFESGARGILAVFRGVPFSEQLKNFRLSLEVRTVNGREERRIIGTPFGAGLFRRVEMLLDQRDLPWRIVNLLSRPEPAMDRMIEDPTFEDADGKLLRTGSRTTRGPTVEQIVVKHQRKEGFLVPTSYEKLAPGKPPVKFVFDDVVVKK